MDHSILWNVAMPFIFLGVFVFFVVGIVGVAAIYWRHSHRAKNEPKGREPYAGKTLGL